MMEYTGNYWTMFSETLGQEVNILECKDSSGNAHPANWRYCDCDMCHKPIKRHMFVVQEVDTDVETMYLGADCVKKFK